MELSALHLSGCLVTLIFGTLLHFVHDWFPNRLTAVLAPVNESTFEHLKLLFWPSALFTAVEYLAYGRRCEGFLSVRLVAILLGMAAIVVLFYTYTGILGRNFLFADILTFAVGSTLTWAYSYFRLCRPLAQDGVFGLLSPLILFFLLPLCFWFFTYDPPHIALFRDPVGGGYGLKRTGSR